MTKYTVEDIRKALNKKIISKGLTEEEKAIHRNYCDYIYLHEGCKDILAFYAFINNS